MELTIKQALKQGVSAHKEGKLQDAERFYRTILQSQPLHPDANHNLGVIALSVNKADVALPLFKTALKANPKIEQFWLSYIDALIKTKKVDDARRVLANAQQAGIAKRKLQIFEVQLQSELSTSSDISQQELGNQLQSDQGKISSAITHYNLGSKLQEQGRLDEALASYTQAIALKPDFAEALANRGYLLFDKGDYEAALKDADACILGKQSRVLPLISLYALGRVSEIYKRLEIQSKSDAENISLAAFATFISEVEKKPTAYKFCPNPMDFIHIANLSSHLNDSVTLVEGIIEELNEIETIWEPSGKTTINGFQSIHGINLFENSTDKISQLQSIIINEIEEYYLKFQNEQCLYIQKFPTARNLRGWTVTLKKTGHQDAHIHTDGWLSGVIYLKVVPSLEKDEGAIEFGLNSKYYHDANSPSLTFQPEVGDIVFFPSSLHHKTIPFTTDTDRITISFDLKPETASTLSKQKKSLTFSEKSKKLTEQKKVKRKTKKQDVIGISPPQEQLSSLLECYQNGRFSDAEKLAVSITNDFPKHQFGWKVLGAVLKQTGRVIDSLTAMQKSIKLAPQDAEAHYNLGATLQELGRLAEAEASYIQAIALEPGLAEAHSNLGATLKQLGRLEESETSCIQAISLKPDYAEAHSNLGDTLKQLGRLEESEASYIQAIALEPGLAAAHSNLGNTLKQLGRLEEAVVSYTQAISLKPDLFAAHSNLGATLQELGRLDEAEASYNKAIALKPKDFKTHNQLLMCLFLQDKKSVFFDELDYLINQDKASANIGSLTCRSYLKYGLEKPNLFCSKPLKYVLHNDLSTQYDFEKVFVENTKSILEDNKILNRKQSLLVNGNQTSGNIFEIINDDTIEIQNIIRIEVEKYREKFKKSEEGLIKKMPAEYNLYGWLISMKKGGNLRPHIHTEGWLSGSIYINVPQKLKVDCGNLVVSLGEENDATEARINEKKTINVVTGSMVLFPASLMHFTIPFESEEERIVLAFDVREK